jgi:DNA-binding Lrp family transcriptional regulator
MKLSATELALVDRWQRDFPLISRPFEMVGLSVGIDESTAIETYERLRRQNVISRIGAVVKPHTLGASTLAAMRVPPERLEQVAAIVSREPLVNHNYERTNDHNLWFVVAGPHLPAVAATIEYIEEQTGLAVLDLPLLQAYHLDLGFSVADGSSQRGERAPPTADYRPDSVDRELLAAIEDGLPIVEQPYRDVATEVGLDERDVIDRFRRLTASGVVTRFGCVVRHRLLGYTANAMAVWDVPDDRADAVATLFVRNPRVTLCYRRSRRLPEWPYNFYCMVHAKSQHDALAVIDELNYNAAIARNEQTVLFSTRCFKQRGAVFSDRDPRVH